MNMKALAEQFAPTGKLRAAINLGNPILAKSDASTGEPRGVSVDLATALAHRLNLPLEFVVVDSAGKAVDGVTQQRADIGFFAVDPLRGEGIAFTAPYVLIEGCYLVREESEIQTNEDVDREGHLVVVGRGSAYDLFLGRELHRANIYRAPTSPTVVDVFFQQNADVAAGVRQQLESDAKRHKGLRLLEERFMVIAQAMGAPKSRSPDVHAFLADFVEEAKATRFVAGALARHEIVGASIAPPIR